MLCQNVIFLKMLKKSTQSNLPLRVSNVITKGKPQTKLCFYNFAGVYMRIHSFGAKIDV